MTAAPDAPAPPAPARRAPSGIARRHATDRAMTVLLALVMAGTAAVLAWVLAYVAGQGLQYLGPSFFTTTPPGTRPRPAAATPTASSAP